MTQDIDALLGFAPDYDSAIPYMRRTREYYAAIGYTTPYRWAHYIDAPFTKLSKPLNRSRVAMITTAAPCTARAICAGFEIEAAQGKI